MMCLVFEEMPSPDLSASPSPQPPPIPLPIPPPHWAVYSVQCTKMYYSSVHHNDRRSTENDCTRDCKDDNTLWERRGVARVAKHLSPKGTQR